MRTTAYVLALGAFALTIPAPLRAAGSESWIARPRALGNQVVGEVRIGGGIACYRNGITGPASFLAADIGKPGVPVPPTTDSRVLRARFRDLDPKRLRFVRLRLAKPHLVVFLASVRALCDPTQPPFKDLNASCNEYYEPLEYGDRTISAPDCG